MAEHEEQRMDSKARAFWFLFLGVFFWSLMPLTVAVSGAGDRPFLFAAIFSLFSAVGLILYLVLFKRDYLHIGLGEQFQQQIKPKSTNPKSANSASVNGVTASGEGVTDGANTDENMSFWDKKVLWLTFIGRFEVLLFAWSTQFVDTAVATIIYELWVIWFVFFRSRSVNRDSGKQKIASQSWIYLALAAVGLIFVNIAQNGTISSLAYQGLALAFAASILAALQIERPLRYGEIAAERHLTKQANLRYGEIAEKRELTEQASQPQAANTATDPSAKDKEGDIALVHTLFVIIVTTLISSVVNAAIFLFRLANDSSKFDYTTSQITWTIAGGIVIGSAVFIFNRKGNHLAKEAPDLNAIAYATPVLAIIWLLAWNRIDIARFDMFIMGAALIVAVNLMINFKADLNRVGFQWLVASIWIAGVAIYFRDWVGSLSSVSWLWEHEIVDYYTIVALSVTVFTLILAFRASRLVQRTQDEEKLAFSLYRNLESLGEQEAAVQIVEIDKSQSIDELVKFHSHVDSVISEVDNSLLPISEKAKLRSDLDSLATSKTRNRDLSEPIVLIIFAFIAVSLTVFTRPIVSNEAEEWVGFLLECFSVLFSATIIFLTVNLFDIMSERKISIFEMFHAKANPFWKQEKMPKTSSGLISSYIWQRRISAFLVLSMVALFGLLLWSKWLGADWLVEVNLISVG